MRRPNKEIIRDRQQQQRYEQGQRLAKLQAARCRVLDVIVSYSNSESDSPTVLYLRRINEELKELIDQISVIIT